MSKQKWMYLALGLVAVGGYMWWKSKQDNVTKTAEVPQTPAKDVAEQEQQFLGIKSGTGKKIRKAIMGGSLVGIKIGKKKHSVTK